MLSRASRKLLRKRTWKKRVQKQGLNCVKSRIREAAAQAHAESPPRPNTYSWTAAFALLGKSVTRISTCVREETGNQRRLTLGLLCARKEMISCDKKNAAFSRRKHMDLSPCAQRHVPAKRLLRIRAAQ